MSYRNCCEVQVQVNGRPVKEHYHNGLTYVEGKQGSKYSIKLKNNTAIRKLAIISVDGIDVLKGSSADEAESGYIINGWSSIEIKGYRVDDGSVAEFVFSDKHKSYAKVVTKTTANSGVIGVRFFDEKEKPPVVIKEDHHHYHPYPKHPKRPRPYWPNPYWPPYWEDNTFDDYSKYSCDGITRGLSGGTHTSAGDMSSFMCKSGDTTSNAGNFQANINNLSVCNNMPQVVPDFNLGTGWGDKVADPVTTVSFERGNLVAEIEIYYTTRKAMEKIGISFDTRKQVYEPSLPKAFGSSSYCKPPQGWNK